MKKLWKIIHSKVTWDTQDGTFITKDKVGVTGLKLPKFAWSREVTGIFHLLDKPDGSRYDFILVRGFQQSIGMEFFNGAISFI